MIQVGGGNILSFILETLNFLASTLMKSIFKGGMLITKDVDRNGFASYKQENYVCMYICR
jgi:hypothetical protein